ncbi:unnamed protein product [Heligmosomoides polygyrus]|uniref:GBD/FH3 domain-containing protein n=1 Tax=Heligmosomoides polygyrus TaxID=6339 RepID=A0A183G6K6_HELPZ|nr:unnamed protein product [Heligmosomoides polygyrus]
MARCLAECVDGVGLHRLSRLDVGHQMCLDGMLDLIKCCLIANLPEYAFAVANVLHDIGLDYTGPNRQMRYGLALRRAYKWTEVSYPKRFRDLEVLRLSTNGVTRKELETMPIARHALLAVLIVRSEAGCLTLRSTDSRHLVITSLLTKLCGLKAFAPCLSILEKCTGSLSSVEKCRVLISKCDISTAEHMLRALLESSTSAEPELAVELRCLLAELLADHKNELSEAISSLRQGLGNMENSAVGCEVRIRFFTLLHRLGARQLVGMEEHMESRAFRMREDAIREWTRQQTVTGASQGPRSHVARRIDCELRCEKAAVASVRQNLVASAIDTVVAGLDALMRSDKAILTPGTAISWFESNLQKIRVQRPRLPPGLKFVPPTCSARLRLARHGCRRVRHVYGSPCTVADVFGTSSESRRTLDDVFVTSSESRRTLNDVFGTSSESRRTLDDVFGTSSESRRTLDDVFGPYSESRRTLNYVFSMSSESLRTSDDVLSASSESLSSALDPHSYPDALFAEYIVNLGDPPPGFQFAGNRPLLS